MPDLPWSRNIAKHLHGVLLLPKPGWLPRSRRDEAAAGDHQRRQRSAPEKLALSGGDQQQG
jgi:hypothetical protein